MDATDEDQLLRLDLHYGVRGKMSPYLCLLSFIFLNGENNRCFFFPTSNEKATCHCDVLVT